MGESSILLFCWINSLNISSDIFFYYHGLGDSVLFNSVVYELGRQTGKRYLVGTKHREIYQGNPHALILPFPQYANYKIFRILGSVFSLKIHHIDYYYEGYPPKRHVLELLCDRVGLEKPIKRPSIFLSEKEKEICFLPYTGKPWVAIQSTGLSTWTDNKNWGVDHFRKVARLLEKDFSIVQLGAPSDPSLGVSLELQGRLELRDVFILLTQCKVFIGQVGFLMHAATAVGLPSVIVYGGFEAPWQSGYNENINLYSDVGCAPCWLENKCPYEKKCMTMISPQQVAEKAEIFLMRTK
jgi:ADP-heptose:LPS heptosyltransferase